MPVYTDASTADSLFYTYDVNGDWTLVENGTGTAVYAYAGADMTVLQPSESTTALTNQMTMRSITNAEYAAIDDINISITGYAMGTEEMSTNPTDAWSECETIGGIQ